jgi:hypothetical protein
LLFSTGLNYIKEVPTQLLTQINGIVTEAEKQIPASDPTAAPSSPTPPASIPTGTPTA